MRKGRLPPAGAFPYLPLGEGAAAAADEGRYQVGSAYRPTPVRASPCHPLPGEGLAPSSVPGYARSTFPVGEGDLRRGLFISVRPGPVGVPSTPAACGRHPLQAGEGRDFLRRGHSFTFPWGKVPPQRRMRGGTRSVLPTAPHPSGPPALTPSPRRGYGAPHPARAAPGPP